MTASPPLPASPGAAWLRRAFGFAVAAFAWWRFSENTTDNDLWGHVLYGQRMLQLGGLETRESLSWTASGQPWINHEVFAELALGLAHRVAGATGIWVLMVGLAAITLGLAWQAGAGRDRAQRLVALALLALATNFIALGYAARPQLFTFLCFVLLLVTLRRLFSGRRLLWAAFPPLLLAAWTNTHGGFLAGWLVVLCAVAAECGCAWLPALHRFFPRATGGRNPLTLILVAAASTLTLAANPWGWKLVLWTIATLRLPRPHLYEWQPMPFTTASLPFFAVLAVGSAAWVCTRQPRRLWEMLVWLLLGVMAIQHQRHAPLFGLASLIVLPVHLRDLLRRLADRTSALQALVRRPVVAAAGALALFVTGGWCLQLSRSAPRQFPYRMVVPRALFPVSALEFMRAHQLTGNTITFFDWGQQVLWELPDNPVSFDGRLDTVYPPEIMDAHWRLYAGADPGQALDLDRARVALLPNGSPAVRFLAQRAWAVAYVDALAVVLIRQPNAISPPPAYVVGGADAVTGSVPFPDSPPALATRVAH